MRPDPRVLRVELIPPPPPPSFEPAARQRYGLAATLFALTFFATTTLGATWYLLTRRGEVTDLLPWLSPTAVRTVWGDPELLAIGLLFSVPLLFILLCHELGHFLAARYYRLPTTLPYFLPAPLGLGTLGAFIRIRAPMAFRRALFDVGIAGPIAGFVALLPFLFLGVARSVPVPLDPAPPGSETGLLLFVPGNCLAMELATRLVHGPLPEGMILDFHPFALAAWIGLLATALNLIPLGQLDGGHILYAVTGRLQRRLALPLWLTLVLLGLVWPGWLIWGLALLVLGLRHPPVRDEGRPLGRLRVGLAVLGLLIFILSFMPIPIDVGAVEELI